MAKFIKFTKEILEAQHLSKLREIGRQIGLRQPAAKKKDELVEGIMGIQSGEIKPVCISNKGAPLKIVIDVSEFYADYSDYIEPEQKPMMRDSGKSDEKEVFEIEKKAISAGLKLLRSEVN